MSAENLEGIGGQQGDRCMNSNVRHLGDVGPDLRRAMEPQVGLRVERTAASAPARAREHVAPAEHAADEPGKFKASRAAGKLNNAFKNLNPFKVQARVSALILPSGLAGPCTADLLVCRVVQRQNTRDSWFNPEEHTAQKVCCLA